MLWRRYDRIPDRSRPRNTVAIIWLSAVSCGAAQLALAWKTFARERDMHKEGQRRPSTVGVALVFLNQ
jgi:hypothetical protein